MIEVRIPKEIRDFKEKMFFGLTLRQNLSLGAALIICVPLYFWGKNYMTEDTLNWLLFLIAMPLLALGFVEYNNLTAEQLFIAWFKMQFNPQRRLYKQESIYDQIRRDVINEDIKSKKQTKKQSSFIIGKGEGRGKAKGGKATKGKKGERESSQDISTDNTL